MRRTILVLVALLLGVFIMTSQTEVTNAAGLVVDSTADITDAAPGDGVCDDGTGACTLRAAVAEANALVGADTIALPAGTYTLNLGSPLVINADVTLNGAGAATTIIEAAATPNTATFRVLQINGNVAISGVTIRHGDGGGFGGGGIHSNGPLTLSDSIVTGNRALFGAGIRNNGSNRTITILNTTISNNTAIVGGGGIMNNGTMIMRNSTVSGNISGPSSGGGIFNTTFGTASVTNSTISDNFGGRGGGIENRGTLTVTNSTISNNTATIVGAGINHEFGDSFGGSVTLKNTIIANFSPVGDCSGVAQFTSLGDNLAGDGTCGLTEPTDQPNTDPLIGPLADNGGPTLTHALLDGSPAIDAADAAACPDTDQRGIDRPQGAGCDIGAYELVQTIAVAIDIKPGSDPNSINPISNGNIAVAILTTDDFDATDVDGSTVEFGPDGASPTNGTGHIEDVDGDGDLDWVGHFKTQATGIAAGDTEACLTGVTLGGDALEGCDAVKIAGK